MPIILHFLSVDLVMHLPSHLRRCDVSERIDTWDWCSLQASGHYPTCVVKGRVDLNYGHDRIWIRWSWHIPLQRNEVLGRCFEQFWDLHPLYC